MKDAHSNSWSVESTAHNLFNACAERTNMEWPKKATGKESSSFLNYDISNFYFFFEKMIYQIQMIVFLPVILPRRQDE